MYLSTIADKIRLALCDGMLTSALSIMFTELYFNKITKNINVDLIAKNYNLLSFPISNN